MARLDDIREELYSKKPSRPMNIPRGDLPFPVKEKRIRSTWDDEASEEGPLSQQSYLSKVKQRRITTRLLFFVGVILAISAVVFFGWKFLLPAQGVDFTLIGPDKITVGDPVVLTIRVVNRSNAVVREGRVDLKLPDGSISADGAYGSLGTVRQKVVIDDVLPGREFKKDIQVRFFGSLNQVLSVDGSYLYRPENIQTFLTQDAELKAEITRVPVAVTVDTPEKVSSGQELTATIGVDSELNAPFPDMAVGVDLPAGFRLTSSDPALSSGSDSIWMLNDLPTGVSQRIVLRGVISGSPEEVKAFHVRLGRYDAKSKTWLVLADVTSGPSIASPFLFVQTFLNGSRNGSLTPGAQVDGNVYYKNNLTQKIQNVNIVLSFPEKLVSLESVRADKGFYDVTKKALVWNPSSEQNLRELNPGEEGTSVFSFIIKEALPIKSFSDKNFFFTVTTAIDTASPPAEYRGISLEYRDSAEFKIESPIRVNARAAFYDSPVANTGPMPPKVRETTTYVVYLQLTSGANDLKDVEVRAQLPGGVLWKNIISSDLGTVSFNPASQEVLWRIPKLPAASGVLRSPVTAVIQVGLTPAENQVNTSPTIMSAIAASGVDTFTDAVENDTTNDLTIELRTDARSKSEEWRVVR